MLLLLCEAAYPVIGTSSDAKMVGIVNIIGKRRS